MELVPSREPEDGITSGAPSPGNASLDPVELRLAQAMNASELMYFFGAPLAHVVDYEDRLRATRCNRTFRTVVRNCRAARFHDRVALPMCGQPGVANDA